MFQYSPYFGTLRSAKLLKVVHACPRYRAVGMDTEQAALPMALAIKIAMMRTSAANYIFICGLSVVSWDKSAIV